MVNEIIARVGIEVIAQAAGVAGGPIGPIAKIVVRQVGKAILNLPQPELSSDPDLCDPFGGIL